jgi:oligopeptide/dipeptide ABC transporter ATP-binding protein
LNERLILSVSNLYKRFPTHHGVVNAVTDVSFEIGKGEALGLVGESGSGKTTVGRCLLRLIEPDSGEVRFLGHDILKIPQTEFRQSRSRIQLVFQDPGDALNPRMKIGDAIGEPLMLTREMSAAERTRRIVEVLELVGLEERLAGVYPHQISTGAQQRVGIARAIATKPDLVVLDEPTSALDVSVRADILNLLRDLQAELGVSYLFISHDLTAVRRLCHRIAIMYLGKIIETGDTESLFEHSLHPYSRALLSSVLYPDPGQKRSEFLLTGEIPSPINLPSGCALHARCPTATEECSRIDPPFEPKAPGHWLSCIHVPRQATADGSGDPVAVSDG